MSEKLRDAYIKGIIRGDENSQERILKIINRKIIKVEKGIWLVDKVSLIKEIKEMEK